MSEPRFKASPEQYEVWLAVQREPESGRFNIPVDLEFTPGVDLPALRGALQDLTARHPLLRSAFVAEGVDLFRIQYPPAPVPLVVRRSDLPYDPSSAACAAAAISMRPFDVARAPLVRAEVLAHPDGALLVLCVHHLVCDGWSQSVLVDDLLAAYRARLDGEGPGTQEEIEPGPGLAELPGAAEASTRYWTDLLADGLPSLAPVVDLNRASSAPGTPAWRAADLDAELLDAVRELARAETASPAVVLLACWLTLLHAWGAAEAGTSGMLFAARQGDERSVDLQARVLPVVSRISPATGFRELVAALRDQVWDSLDHCGVSSEELRALRRTAGHRSLIDPCVFMHFPAPEGEWDLPGAQVRLVQHDSPGAKYDFSMGVLESAHRARVRVDYDADVYREATAQVFLDQYVALVAAAVAAPDRPCAALVSACDPFTPMQTVDPTLPLERTPVHELVLARAARQPDAVAVRHGDQRLSYAGLAARAGALAAWMHTQGVESGDLVALLLPRGSTSIVLWLASLIVGAGYLPLDPGYPDARLQAVLDDARPRLVVGSGDLLGRVRPGQAKVFTVEEALGDALGVERRELVRVAPDGVFNVLYTSGSTGRPKGVVLTHEGFTRLLSRPDFLDLDPSDVVAHLSPLNFDGATYEVWGALAAGAEVVVVDKELVLSPVELRAEFRRHGVTTMLASTPLMNRLIEDVPDLFQTLRRVFCGGEMISVPHLRRVLRWAAPGTVLHGYGPTENSFTSTWWPVDRVEDTARTVTIGAPVPGTRAVVVMDPVGMRTAPRGVPGELWLGGAGLARGYLGDPAATARRYVPDGFSGLPGERLYRTGDRVRWTPEGLLEFIGRDDNQVKIRSQRVELGEIESALTAHALVQAAVVTVVRNRRGEKELAGFAVLEPGGRTEEIRAHLRQVLPAFAVPRYLVPLDEMPLTPNGKVDRTRLPDPAAVSAPQPAPVPARVPAAVDLPQSRLSALAPDGGASGVLEAVRAAWASLVEHDGFGIDDNFFDVGGHSLLLVALAQALREQLGIAPTVADLLRHTTVRAQAALLSTAVPPTAPAVADPAPSAPSAASALAPRAPAATSTAPLAASPLSAPAADVVAPQAAAPGVALGLSAAASAYPGTGAAVAGSALHAPGATAAPGVGVRLSAASASTGTAVPAPVAPAPDPVAAPVTTDPTAVPVACDPSVDASDGVADVRARILPLSARSAQALLAMRLRLAQHLEDVPSLRLPDVATTLDIGREAFPLRCAVVVADRGHAARALRGAGDVLGATGAVEALFVHGRADAPSPWRPVWGFGGIEPGADLTDQVARALAASPVVGQWAAAAAGSGLLTEAEPDSGPVGLYVAQLGLVEELAARGMVPEAVTAVGAGLCAALVVTGTLDFTGGLRLAATLAAADVDATTVRAVLEQLAPDADLRALTLPEDATGLDGLAAALLATGGTPPLGERELGAGEALVLDTGVGTPLAGQDTPVRAHVLRLLSSGEGAPRLQLLAGVAKLWCQGVPMDLTEGAPGRRLRLPGYPFERNGRP